MITLRNLHKSFGAQTLFDDASLQINPGDRFAIVGPNGAGKSTLFKLILGREEPDGGEIAVRSDLRFGYLPQETPSLSGRPVLSEVLSDGAHDGRQEARAKKILAGLGFKDADFERPVSSLSGGWQMRVMIARLLFEEPDLLLLDEPTNHLDLESLLWFQDHLRVSRSAVVMVSHDRSFIDHIAQRIVELRDGKLALYPVPFSAFQEQKKQEEEKVISAYNRQQKEIKELETFISRFRAKATLASSVQSKIKYLERMERIQLPADEKTVGFSFPQPKRSGHRVLMLENIRQSYDGVHWVYDGLDLELERGQRIALVGPNGAGKSTLLKLLAGRVPFQSGERKLGFDVSLGYFSQHRTDMFRGGRTVFEEAADTPRAHSETTIRTLLGSFLFRGDAVFKPVEVLSGGEKSRLGLAKILLDPPNLLLMDEPTTHLDIASVDVLVEALKAYEGTLVFISHDVYFIRAIANHVLHVNNGEVKWYPGGYDYFLHKRALEAREGGPASVSAQRLPSQPPATEDGLEAVRSGKKTKEQKRREAEERNAAYRLKQEKKKAREARAELEEEQAEILRLMGNPETHRDPKRVADLARQLGDVQRRLKDLPA